MNANDTPDAAPADAAPAATAGMILAHTREMAGLTIDDVAMQLKLAPRQVVAIERDDFASLPGRTFIRGFVRNYARMLKLDVDAVLDALPGELGTAPDRPPLAATSRVMGEMPRDRAQRSTIARWLIPLVLIAIVAVAAFYEFAWPPALRPPAPAAPAPSAAPATSAVPLANPVGSESAASAPAQSTATISVPASPQTGDATQPPPTDASPAPAMAAAPTAPGTSLPNPLATPATLTTGAPAAATAPAASSTEPAAGRNLLALRFRGTSWIEVRDRSGSAVLSMTGSAGTTREITVATPGEVIVGNANVVDASWRGRALDLAGQAKQNVARMRLD